MTPAVLAAAALFSVAHAAAPLCSARMGASEFSDPRLLSAAQRYFRPGWAVLRLSRDPVIRPGGYALDVRADSVSISAADAEGAFRGLVAAAGRCHEGRIAHGTAREAPAFTRRGVLEGFYGHPWSWAERRDMADWMSRHRMNLLVIAPKDDPGLREEWRRPMSKSEREELARLVAWARERFVEVAWTLSPGLDMDASDPADRAAAAAKLRAAAAAGVRNLVLAFDDVDTSRAHVRFANRLLAELAPQLPAVEWTFVGAEYWGEAAPSPYLSRVGRDLDRRFRVGWTGGQVLSRAIGLEQSRRFRDYIRHELVLGDNYPVQDRLSGSGRLHWGPLVGREPGLSPFHAAYVANASPLAAASRLPLATSADYAWDPARYDPISSWKEALREIGGEHLARFAAYNASSWLEPGLAPPVDRRELTALSHLRRGLDQELSAQLRVQIEPWAAKLEALARASLATLDLDAKPGDANAARLFERLAAEADALQAVVAGQALDRLVHGGAARLRSLPPPDPRPLRERVDAYCAGDRAAGLLLSASLDRLVAGEALLESAAGTRGRLWKDALPWVGLLSDAAGRARAAVDGRGPGLLRSWTWRWNDRSHFIGLAASRTLLEDFLARAEGKKAKPLPWTLRAWLAVAERRFPDSLAAQLDSALRASHGDDAPLRALFEELAALPKTVRERLPGQLAEEGSPWLDKVGEYGRLGLLALDGKAKGPQWEEGRYRLRSSNGLELMFELKLELDAFTRWARLRPDKRPACPEYRLPADPREML